MIRALAYLWKVIRAIVGAAMNRRVRREETEVVHVDFADVPVASSLGSERNSAIATPSENSEGDTTTVLAPSRESEDHAETALAEDGLTDSLGHSVPLNSTCPVDDVQRETTYGETPLGASILISVVDVGAPRCDEILEAVVADSAQSPQRTDTAEESVAIAATDDLGDQVDDGSFEVNARSRDRVTPAPEVTVVDTEPPPADRVRRESRGEASDRHPEPVTEYAIAGSPLPSTDYRTWNRAIAEHLLLQTSAAADVYLTITPRILARVLVDVQGVSLDAEQAQEYFARSVAGFYHARVLTHSARLRTLRRNGDDGLPECIGFLALTVLAAYRMRSDEEATGLAYYVRLAELLQCDVAGQYPRGFDPLVFESLWYFLRDWLAQRLGGRLIIAASDSGSRRFVALALGHVPLRSLDVEKLPDFFVWAGYQPSCEVPPARLAADFARWIRARNVLTPTGAAAFSDARLASVIAQIRSELDSWDGTCDESVSRRSAAVEVLFDPVQHRPDLFYVPRRPTGFPARFDDGVHAADASDDGWYGRIPVTPQDGSELANGFTWHAQFSGVEFTLRRVAASVISLTPSDDYSYSGFLSARGLRRGVRCAVLCQEAVANAAAEYLSHVTERACTPLRHPNLPDGWSLFAQVLARRLSDAPAGLETIDVQATVGLIPSGGIRLGNRWTWLQGAPPRVIVTGSEPGIAVTVDGQPTVVAEDGVLQAQTSLAAVGAHVIQVGPLRRTVEIVEPSFPPDWLSPTTPSPSRAPVVLALPAGEWTVIGATPGDIARPKYTHQSGTIVECGFVPSWAIRVGPRRGSVALSVFAGIPPAPKFAGGLTRYSFATRPYLPWASAIYEVAVRHPRVASMTSEDGLVGLSESWKSYARFAGQIKRAFRRCFR